MTREVIRAVTHLPSRHDDSYPATEELPASLTRAAYTREVAATRDTRDLGTRHYFTPHIYVAETKVIAGENPGDDLGHSSTDSFVIFNYLPAEFVRMRLYRKLFVLYSLMRYLGCKFCLCHSVFLLQDGLLSTSLPHSRSSVTALCMCFTLLELYLYPIQAYHSSGESPQCQRNSSECSKLDQATRISQDQWRLSHHLRLRQ